MGQIALITRQNIIAAEDNDIERPVGPDVLQYLSRPCGISSDVKLSDLMSHVSQNPRLQEFLSDYVGADIAAYHAEALDTPPAVSRLEHVEVAWYANWRDGNVFTASPQLQGVGPDEDKGIKIFTQPSGQGVWSVAYTPLNELAGLYLRADATFRIVGAGSQQSMVVKSEMTFIKAFTLLDVLQGVYSTVCHFESPDARDEAYEEVLAFDGEDDDDGDDMLSWLEGN